MFCLASCCGSCDRRVLGVCLLVLVGDVAALSGGETAAVCGEGFLVILLALVGDTAGFFCGGVETAFSGEGFLLIPVVPPTACCRRTGSGGATALPAAAPRGAVAAEFACVVRCGCARPDSGCCDVARSCPTLVL